MAPTDTTGQAGRLGFLLNDVRSRRAAQYRWRALLMLSRLNSSTKATGHALSYHATWVSAADGGTWTANDSGNHFEPRPSTGERKCKGCGEVAGPDEGITCRPGIPLLAMETSLGDKTVERSLANLRRVGLIRRTVKGSTLGMKGFADEYHLAINHDLVEELAADLGTRTDKQANGERSMHVRWDVNRGIFKPGCPYCEQEQARGIVR